MFHQIILNSLKRLISKMSRVLPAEGPAFGLVFSGMQSPAFKSCLWVGGVSAGIVLHGDLLIALAVLVLELPHTEERLLR